MHVLNFIIIPTISNIFYTNSFDFEVKKRNDLLVALTLGGKKRKYVMKPYDAHFFTEFNRVSQNRLFKFQ